MSLSSWDRCPHRRTAGARWAHRLTVRGSLSTRARVTSADRRLKGPPPGVVHDDGENGPNDRSHGGRGEALVERHHIDYGLASPVDATDARSETAPLIAAARQPSSYELTVKPVLDRILAAVLLLVLAVPMALIALAIRVTLGPGVIYRQDRVGLGGATVRMLKFRTMHHDRRRDRVGRDRPDRRLGDRRSGDRRRRVVAFNGADRRTRERRTGERRTTADPRGRRRTHKSVHDPRHTRFGRALRALSLDELPQLVNVLRGELSLVGPRPELVEVVATYEPWQHARHAVKPGLTGLWQITERGDHEPMHRHVDTDLRYIDQLSLATDLRILALTPLVLLGLFGGGANRGR
jgi:lipopolysaccharide/colanic/teichoic acid biosynthesis glycosyltransferase